MCLGYKGEVIKSLFWITNRSRRISASLWAASTLLNTVAIRANAIRWVTLAGTGLRTMTGSRIASGNNLRNEGSFMLTDRDAVNNIDKLIALHGVVDRQVMVYEHNGFCHCIDTVGNHQLLNGLCEQGRTPWIV